MLLCHAVSHQGLAICRVRGQARGGLSLESNALSFFRMTFKMYAVDFCELLLYDEQKQSYHMMQHAFQSKNALEAFIG